MDPMTRVDWVSRREGMMLRTLVISGLCAPTLLDLRNEAELPAAYQRIPSAPRTVGMAIPLRLQHLWSRLRHRHVAQTMVQKHSTQHAVQS